MKVLVVREPRFGWYPALTGEAITDAERDERIAQLRAAGWSITESRIVDDGKTPAEAEATFRAEWTAERVRCAGVA